MGCIRRRRQLPANEAKGSFHSRVEQSRGDIAQRIKRKGQMFMLQAPSPQKDPKEEPELGVVSAIMKPLWSCLDILHKAYRITPPTPGDAPCFAAWFPKLRLAELIVLSSLGRPAKKHLTIGLWGIESRNNRHEKYIAFGPRWIQFQRSGTPEFRPGPVSWVESPFAGRNHWQHAVRPRRAKAGASTPDPTATA